MEDLKTFFLDHKISWFENRDEMGGLNSSAIGELAEYKAIKEALNRKTSTHKTSDKIEELDKRLEILKNCILHDSNTRTIDKSIYCEMIDKIALKLAK